MYRMSSFIMHDMRWRFCYRMLNYYLMYIIHVTSDFFSKLKSMNERRMFLLLSRITE